MAHEISEVIGPRAFAILTAAVGGCDYNIPSSLDTPEGVALCEMIGAEDAARFVAWGGGARVYLPYSRDAILMERAMTIVELAGRGVPIPEIARTFRYVGRYSERQIRMILAAARRAPEAYQADPAPERMV